MKQQGRKKMCRKKHILFLEFTLVIVSVVLNVPLCSMEQEITVQMPRDFFNEARYLIHELKQIKTKFQKNNKVTYLEWIKLLDKFNEFVNKVNNTPFDNPETMRSINRLYSEVLTLFNEVSPISIKYFRSNP